MLSMTASRIAIENNRLAAVQFAFGAALIVFIQSLIAVFFATYLSNNPFIISSLKKASIIIFVSLAVYFFREARVSKSIKGKQNAGNSFLTGLGMSSLNQLAIPYFLVFATLIEDNKLIEFDTINSIIFAFGASAGALLIFYIYGIYAEMISKRSQFIAKNINYILSVFFIGLATVNLIKLL